MIFEWRQRLEMLACPTILMSLHSLFSLFLCLQLFCTFYIIFCLHPHSVCLLDRWGERADSSFSAGWLSIHQGHSSVWIMSELRSKYLTMTSCLDWCSYAIWCFMHHHLDCLAVTASSEKACPVSAPGTLRKTEQCCLKCHFDFELLINSFIWENVVYPADSFHTV